MIDAKSPDSARPVNPEFVEKTYADLQDGLQSRSLQKLMDDIDLQRRTNPGGMNDYLAAVNERVVKQYGNVVIADSGKADVLRIEDPNHMRGVTLRADGKPLAYDKPVVKAGPAAASDLMAAPTYSNIAPPGLAELPPGATIHPEGRPDDFTLNGQKALQDRTKFGVLERDSQATHNADGSTTYKYKGLLDSSFGGDFGNGYTLVKTGNVHFTGSETISADGKVLNRHVDYEPAGQKRTLPGFMIELSPNVDTWQKRTVPVLDAKFANYDNPMANDNDVLSIDTAFNPATSRYDTTAKYMNGRELHLLNDTTGKDVAVMASDCKGSFAGIRDQTFEDRDANGFVTTTYKKTDYYSSVRHKSSEIKRDANEEVIEFTDISGKTSKRIEPDAQGNNWMGPDGPFKAEVFTDNAGNIVRKTADGARITDSYGQDTWVDNRGVIVREHTMPGTQFEGDVTYKFDAGGQSIGFVRTEVRNGSDGAVSRNTYDISTKPQEPRRSFMPLMTHRQDYCIELK